MRYLALACFLVACGPPADVVSRRGSQSFLGAAHDTGLTQARADAMEDFLSAGLVAYGFRAADTDWAIGHVSVDWAVDLFPCNDGVHAYCRGQTYLESHTSKVAQDANACPWASAYVHEMLHNVQDFAGLEGDANHERPEWQLVNSRPADCLER